MTQDIVLYNRQKKSICYHAILKTQLASLLAFYRRATMDYTQV
jgi:hypothetical protein